MHGRPAVTYALLGEYGATVVDDAQSSFNFRDGAFEAAAGDTFDAAGDMLATALERVADESVDALIVRRTHDEQSRAAGEWVRRLVSGFDAADTARAGARAIAQEWGGAASADGAQSRPLGGYAPLVAHLARTLEPERVELSLATVVTQIRRDATGVQIAARSGQRDIRLHASRVIVTVPLGVLTAAPDARGAIVFDPPLPAATRDALARIAMGPVIKVVLRFRSPFWERLSDGAYRDGAYFNGDDIFPTLWTQLPVRANTLVAWAGGLAAMRLADADGATCCELARACVGRYFGDAAQTDREWEAAYVHDWQRDPFARGAYSYALVGGENAREALAAAIDGRLWFAGEATAADGEGGTVAGALTSGLRAAREILAFS